ncbi:DeoR/GlpR family DNA-binding transcription regulator [Mesorhizobium kowhaii]|uniref:DeoR/GlpR family DNA-binding transcription regulator n=1 Tax=Mesorhizobium kowhaii TaxID=1300272 RepID=UPI000DAB571E|nr:DeoR/GlpR family DNA-binding transcription regulator [Mesorhizobium kowhaii]
MRPSERHDEITSLLNHAGEMTVEELAEKLQVSRETIRRDLSKLDASGQLRKFHGGARASAVASEPFEKEGPFPVRMAQNSEAKKKIAVAAARLFKPDDAIFIDTGSTTVAMAEELAKLQSLVIITNSPRIAATVSTNPSHRVFLIGGAYGADAGESVGPLALEQITKFRARYAIITIGAIDASSLMDFDLQEAEVAKAMISRADKVIVLADHSKFDKRAVFEVAPLAKISAIVTDRPLSAQLSAAFSNLSIEMIIA